MSAKQKTILLLHQYFSTPEQDGAHRTFYHSLNLSKNGYKVVVITTNRDTNQKKMWEKVEINRNFLVYYLRNSGYFHGKKATNLQRIYSFLRFSLLSSIKSLMVKKDIVYATSTPLTIAIPAIVVRILQFKDYIFEVRDMWPDAPIKLGYIKNPFLKFLSKTLEKAAYYFSKAIVVVSPGMEKEIRDKGFSSKKIITIENGCDEMFIKYHQNESTTNLDLSDYQDKKIILYAGSISPIYGIDFLINIAKNMLNIDADVIFLVAGRGELSDKMLDDAKNAGILNNNFHYLGALPKNIMPQLYNLSSVSLCLGNGQEVAQKHAVNNKFFDSIASGVPIATNFESFQTNIARNYNFCIDLKLEDPEKSAKNLYEKINNKEWMSRASKQARNLAETKYNRELQTQRLIKLLNEF